MTEKLGERVTTEISWPFLFDVAYGEYAEDYYNNLIAELEDKIVKEKDKIKTSKGGNRKKLNKYRHEIETIEEYLELLESVWNPKESSKEEV